MKSNFAKCFWLVKKNRVCVLCGLAFLVFIPLTTYSMDQAEQERHLSLFEAITGNGSALHEARAEYPKPLDMSESKYQRSMMKLAITNRIKQGRSRDKELTDTEIAEIAFMVSEFVSERGYLVKLRFTNPKRFPTLYGYSKSFNENKSAEYYTIKSKEIIDYFLGAERQKYQPTLYAVIETVAIHLFVTDKTELAELLKLPHLISAETVADNHFEIIIAP